MAQLPDDEWVDDEQDWVDDSDFVDDKPTVESIQLSPEQVQDSPSVLQSGLRKYFTPMTDIGRRSARGIRDFLGEGDDPLEQLSRKAVLPITDFLGGAIDESTSPVNAIPTALSLGASAPVSQGLSRVLSGASRIASAPTAAHGVSNMMHKDSTPMERLMGGIETVGGLMGMRGFGNKAPKEVPEPDIPTSKTIHPTEILDAEPELDIFGISKNRDLTPEEVAKIKQSILENERQYYGTDQVAFDDVVDEASGIINTSSKEADFLTSQIRAANDEGLIVLPPGYKGSKADYYPVRKLSQGYIAVRRKQPGEKVTKEYFDSLQEPVMPAAELSGKLDYSPTAEKKAKDIISSYGETNFEGMSNKQIIDMAEQVEPGWQSQFSKTVTTPKELTKPNAQPIRMKLNDDGTFSPDGDVSIKIDPKTGKITKTEIVDDVPVKTEVKEPSLLMEVLNLPRALQASMDLSFPFRQGLGLIHHKGWWKAWPDMVKSFGSDKAFQGVMESIAERPNFAKGLKNGKVVPSFADESGLAITDNLTTREHEYFANKFANLVPGVKASNRAYTAFANKLRADVFDSLVDDFTKAGLDPRKNTDLAKELAAYVNNASGRGNLGALEKSADVLGQFYFSPRLLASRANMLGKGTTSLMREGFDLAKNPKAYVSAPPNIRKEYLKSMMAMGSAWGTIAGLGAASGATVNMDATNSDFGKIKIGNTRIDPGGGFLQFAVLAQRLAPERLGGMRTTGSESGETQFFKDAKSKYDPTWGSTVGNFNYSKSSPLARYIWDWATQLQEKGGKSSFDPTDATARLFTPILVQDLLEILNDSNASPEELATLPLNAIGMGTQTYGAGRDYKRRMLGGLGQ